MQILLDNCDGAGYTTGRQQQEEAQLRTKASGRQYKLIPKRELEVKQEAEKHISREPNIASTLNSQKLIPAAFNAFVDEL